jgi:hypothetical protein
VYAENAWSDEIIRLAQVLDAWQEMDAALNDDSLSAADIASEGYRLKATIG